MASTVGTRERLLAGCSKRPSSKAAGESKPEAYPLGYVEDFDELRTQLADFFSILQDRSREDEHAGSRIASGFQVLQRTIGIGEGERQGVGFDRNCSRLAQEIEPVLPRVGCHTPD